MTKTISVQQGLNELKLLDSRIGKSIINLNVYASLLNKGNELAVKTNANETVADFNNNAKADLQSILDLIKLHSKIKKAIVLSNAKTEVSIAGKKYTVAEAIEFKNIVSDYYNQLSGKLNNQYANTVSAIENHNFNIKNVLNKRVETLLSSEDKKSDSYKTIYETLQAESEKELASINKFKVSYNGENVDSTELFDVILEDVESFMSEVDYVLTSSNVKTEITID